MKISPILMTWAVVIAANLQANSACASDDVLGFWASGASAGWTRCVALID